MRPLAIAVIALALMAIPVRADRFEELWDKFHLIEQTSRLDLALDERDWPTVEAMFDDVIQIRVLRVRTMMSRDSFVSRWRNLYTPDKDVFHMTTNHIVDLDGDSAMVVADGYVWNRLRGTPGGDEWEVWGIFRYGFTRKAGRWLIDEYQFIPDREVGNRSVATAGMDLTPVTP